MISLFLINKIEPNKYELNEPLEAKLDIIAASAIEADITIATDSSAYLENLFLIYSIIKDATIQVITATINGLAPATSPIATPNKAV